MITALRLLLAFGVSLTCVPSGFAAAADEPAFVGTWVGEATDIQGDRVTKYPVIVTLGRTSGTIEYPSLKCGGRLTGIGQSTPYVFFIETITHGGYDAARNAEGCIPGAITVRTTDGKLGWGWVGVYDGRAISATAVLSRKPK
jgi:hypothetical protein